MTEMTDIGSRVAIVGMACRLPGARNVDEFWANLCAGVDSIRRLSSEEMTAAGLEREELGQPHHVPFGALMDDIDRFDAPFFGITAREAELMDPQHRVFLECAWSALEHAGYDPTRLAGSVGVFGGANFDSYLTRNLIPAKVFEDKAAVLQAILANDKDYLATRVAYKLNLRGPAYTVQCGCSTSLVAVHLAAQSLLNYECDLALAGGVAIDISRAQGYWSHEGSVFSPDGQCRAFDAAARGTVFGNGCALVTLKRAEDAMRDGDTIYALVLGSATNNDGSVKVGFTAPSVSGQSAVIVEALADAGVPSHAMGYVETHGTATPMGDPIEVQALTQAFGPRPQGYAPCGIGSVKTNVGHLDSAAGVTGLIKAALSLHHKLLPPSLHYSTPNPAIEFEKTPFFVNVALTPWTSGTRPGWPRRAGVSSFGMGGTNAHVVLEEAPAVQRVEASRGGHQLLVWSARTPDALGRSTEALLAHLRAAPDEALPDIAYTLQVGRSSFTHRCALACTSIADAVRVLETGDSSRLRSHAHAGASAVPVAFACPGSVPALRAHVRDLYPAHSLFREQFDACAADVRTEIGLDLGGWLNAPTDDACTGSPAEIRLLQDAALFCIEFALAELWRGWGITPSLVIGEGVGELVAAAQAGVLSRRDALRVVGQSTAAGTPVSQLAGVIRLSAPSVPLVSAAAGRLVEDDEATNPHFWAEVLTRRADSLAAGETLARAGQFQVLTLGSVSALSAALQERCPAHPTIVHSLGVPPEPGTSDAALIGAVGELWLHGAPIAWDAMHGRARRRVPVPTYAFDRARFWIDPPEEEAAADVADDATIAARRIEDPADWLYLPSWKQSAPVTAYARRDAAALNWLVFAGDDPVSSGVVARLRAAAGDRVITVRAGARFEGSPAADAFIVRSSEADDYRLLMAALASAGRPPSVVVHLWGLATGSWDPPSIATALARGYYSLLGLMQGIAEGGDRQPLSLRIVTTNGYDVLGTEPVSGGATVAAALARVIAQEWSNVECSALDVDTSVATGGRIDALVEQIVGELAAAVPEPVVAYRGTSRWVQGYEPVRLARHAPLRPLKARGTCLIVGGLGRIGLSIASHLARTTQARLVLMGRTALPERASWPSIIERSAASDPVRRRIEQVQAIEDGGGEVLLVEADVADRAALAAAFARAEERFGRVDGVIVAAGVVDRSAFRPVEELGIEESERQFRPKVDGLLSLDAVLATRSVDFCCVISSLSSVLGGLGYGAYAAANAFMDAFVRRKARDGGTRWITVNWDAWRWTETGQDVPGAALAALAMTSEEAADVFDRAIGSSGIPQVVVSTSSLKARMAVWVDRVGARDPAVAVRALMPPPAAAGPDGLAADADAIPSDGDAGEALLSWTPTERAIVEAWQQVLGIRHVELHETFLDLGGSSLTAVQAISLLERTFGIRIAIEEFIFQTASQLAGLCEQKMAQRAVTSPAAESPKGGLLRSLRTVLTGRA